MNAADKKLMAEMIAAAVAAATGGTTPAASTPAKKGATKASPAPTDGDIGEPALVPLANDGDYARIAANRYQGAMRVAVAKAFTNQEGEIAFYRSPRQAVYLTTRDQVDAAIKALQEARKHLPA